MSFAVIAFYQNRRDRVGLLMVSTRSENHIVAVAGLIEEHIDCVIARVRIMHVVLILRNYSHITDSNT